MNISRRSATEPLRIGLPQGLDWPILARFVGVGAVMVGLVFAAEHARSSKERPASAHAAEARPAVLIANYSKNDVSLGQAASVSEPLQPAMRAPADPWWQMLFANSAMAAELAPTKAGGSGLLGAPVVKNAYRLTPAEPWPTRVASSQARVASQEHPRSSATPRVGRSVTLQNVEAVDGRTLRSGKLEVELSGVELPSPLSMCTMLNGKSTPCAARAQTRLELLVRSQSVSCQVFDGASGRAIGRCVAGKYDLAQWLVKEGWLRQTATPAPGA